MNRQEFIGHIGNDAEVKDLGINQVINFSVAVSESYVNKTTNEKITNTTWYECAKWGNNTQIAQYLKKGQQVYIMGKPNNRAWQNEQGDIKVVNAVKVTEILLLGGKQSNDNNAQPQQQPQQPQQAPQPQNNEDFNNSEEHDDLPF
ncbi:putative single-stranded DNA-binding protein [Flavobacterium phage FCOV-F14]|uniref:Single-stranded DNA-binding protein n=7 Tax=Ficleduovirus FCL2 TaxID=2560473 RepID=A0A7G8L454_9CAUD|nr:putative single-stranded DNA-binding protein [Flavobacterium phage FCOV-F13]QCW21247.1 putative single-stranded DNA-binding protein [Flavobacterium phage FCOV-F16]QCW21549.1 putative single-stranded DNA-binding protein [Flavobacterium phage FCOV-F45]QCW21623.1 putative single-stranded DNA-binding protein [Flavobacterium phage FCOV-F46]QCW21697.1 putative single-stranded DNA-binding protein [Flavobacterium phage FCOV-F54]QNJ51719.1 putative single-stranded DNA-binding protein [Flavobacterium